MLANNVMPILTWQQLKPIQVYKIIQITLFSVALLFLLHTADPAHRDALAQELLGIHQY
jgi:hypothetical protein